MAKIIPQDQRHRIDVAPSNRSRDQPEVWSELRDLLIKRDVVAPLLRIDPPKSTDWETIHKDAGRGLEGLDFE